MSEEKKRLLETVHRMKEVLKAAEKLKLIRMKEKLNKEGNEKG